MPAILTHDFFGKDVLDANPGLIADTTEERRAFLLGNQGPDPLFYLRISPGTREFHNLGGIMHAQAPSKIIAAMAQSLQVLEPSELGVGRAYAAGFMCHYTLDRAMHPFVYSHEYAICDAGVPGLTRQDASRVHAEIERELDEAILFNKTCATVATYRPYAQVLQAADTTLDTIGKMYAYVSMVSLRVFAPRTLFGQAVKCFRIVQRFFYSPDDALQEAVNGIETKVLKKHFSLYKSMSHRDRPTACSDFDNRGHQTWINPFTQQAATTSFWDIYHDAQIQAAGNIRQMLREGFDLTQARKLTQGQNFGGEQVEFVEASCPRYISCPAS